MTNEKARRYKKKPGPKPTAQPWEKSRQGNIKFTDAKKQKYIDSIIEQGQKGHAAIAAGVSRQTVLNHINSDPLFAEAVEDAAEEYGEKIIAHARKLMFEGYRITRRFHKNGKIRFEKIEYPIPLIAMELKRIDPSYRDSYRPAAPGNNASYGVLFAPAGMSPEDWIRQQEELNKTREPPESYKGRKDN